MTRAATGPIATLVASRARRAVRVRRRPATPAELAAHIVPGYRITPTIALISDALAHAVTLPDQRLIITTPPRTGKSVLISEVGPVFALSRNLDTKVILTSYPDTLAQEHSHAARALITEHVELLGFRLRSDKAAVGRWASRATAAVYWPPESYRV